MKYGDAKKQVEKYRDSIGKNYKGGIIDEIIIYPTDLEYLAEFKQEYYSTLDAAESIKPFIDFDVNVTAIIDKKRIVQDNVLFFVNLEDLENEFVK
jgi:hypothetical protein